MTPPIFNAIRKNDEATFNQLIQEKPSVIEERDKENNGESVLHLVTKIGHQEFAKTIIGICPSLSTPLDDISEVENDLKLAELVNNDGLTPLHCAAVSNSIKILKVFSHKTPSSFDILTQPHNETVFHLAVRHKNLKAFKFMAQKVHLEKLLYKPDKYGNTVLHTAASLGSTSGLAAVDLLDKDDANFPSIALKFGGESHKEESVMHSEALQNARNTITVVAILIASVTFAVGMNPPGGIYQESTSSKGKSVAAKTVAFKIFYVSNSIALFTSLWIVILLVSIIPFKPKSLKNVLVITHKMMSVSVAALATSYVAVGWIILPHFEGTKWLLYTTLGISIVMRGGRYEAMPFRAGGSGELALLAKLACLDEMSSLDELTCTDELALLGELADLDEQTSPDELTCVDELALLGELADLDEQTSPDELTCVDELALLGELADLDEQTSPDELTCAILSPGLEKVPFPETFYSLFIPVRIVGYAR
ncbi:Ankyrin repeat family protein [Arabidopsis thaliana]|uniref:Ankyrin repeat family protein n=1 Tax=Arabidopsis thaliana TaxID=3702 RepID=F4K1T9_ARATH|nr:Ankyrin repeat family protein [Arabidopsis thaliana]AED96528.1 Ankyrin repeat family protein [Arabidopsis thaliana]|eukprot:NP_200281.1 Ankyrin repeat family protein [Arabidopsis thaliana]